MTPLDDVRRPRPSHSFSAGGSIQMMRWAILDFKSQVDTFKAEMEIAKNWGSHGELVSTQEVSNHQAEDEEITRHTP